MPCRINSLSLTNQQCFELCLTYARGTNKYSDNGLQCSFVEWWDFGTGTVCVMAAHTTSFSTSASPTLKWTLTNGPVPSYDPYANGDVETEYVQNQKNGYVCSGGGWDAYTWINTNTVQECMLACSNYYGLVCMSIEWFGYDYGGYTTSNDKNRRCQINNSCSQLTSSSGDSWTGVYFRKNSRMLTFISIYK